MGPTLIFDKSALEGLTIEEAVWLDQMFLCVITPLFYVETLADLEKQFKDGRTPEQAVGRLALKTPDANSRPCADYKTILEAELIAGQLTDMQNGRFPLSGGKNITLEGQSGTVYLQTPEQDAFQRWQHHSFLDIERDHAREWRQSLSNINLENVHTEFQSWFHSRAKAKSLAEVKSQVDDFTNDKDRESVLKIALGLVGIAKEYRDQIVARWHSEGAPILNAFAPFLMHVFSVDLVFNISIAAGLIGRERPSNKIDVAYLYYLPFCNVFTSGDNLHCRMIPLFLRDNQTFINRLDLKSDLSLLDLHYDAFPEAVKCQGLSTFAICPPDDTRFLTTRLWDKYKAADWREMLERARAAIGNSETSDPWIKFARRFSKAAQSSPDEKDLRASNCNMTLTKQRVYYQKGKWTRFPPEVLEGHDISDGQIDLTVIYS